MSAVTALLTVALCVSLLLVTCRLLGCAWRERRARAYYIGWALLLGVISLAGWIVDYLLRRLKK